MIEAPERLAQKIINDFQKRELPCLSDTLIKLSSIDPNSESAFEELSNIILEDMGLTGKVIATVNSVYYNRSGQEVTTVTQALVLLGFDTVRDIALNMAFLDLAETEENLPLVSILFTSFIAAFLTRDLLESGQEPSGESFFVISLFHSLGRICLCLYDPKLYMQISSEEFGGSSQPKELTILFRDIGRGVAELWGLPQSVLQHMERAWDNGFGNGTSRLIQQTHLAMRAVLFPEGEKVVTGAIREIASSISSSPEKVSEKVVSAFNSALSLSPAFKKTFSQKRLKTVLENINKAATKKEASPIRFEEQQAEAESDYLKFVSQLTSTIAGQRFKLEEVYLFAAEALLRGIPADRVCLSLLSMDKKNLLPRYVIGKKSNGMKSSMILPFPPNNRTAIEAFSKNKVLPLTWSALAGNGTENPMIPKDMKILLAPIVVSQKPIGCFILDNAHSGTPFNPSHIIKAETIRDLVILATIKR